MRFLALMIFLFLAGCATTPVVDAPTALNGKELETALNLYGRWDERVVLDGKQHYIWRRAVVLSGKSYYCELRAEAGFRNTIKASIVEGYPAACGLFSVQYTTAPEMRRKDTLTTANPTVLASRCANCRPVGSPQVSASAAQASRDASARARAPAAGPDGF